MREKKNWQKRARNPSLLLPHPWAESWSRPAAPLCLLLSCATEWWGEGPAWWCCWGPQSWVRRGWQPPAFRPAPGYDCWGDPREGSGGGDGGGGRESLKRSRQEAHSPPRPLARSWRVAESWSQNSSQSRNGNQCLSPWTWARGGDDDGGRRVWWWAARCTWSSPLHTHIWWSQRKKLVRCRGTIWQQPNQLTVGCYYFIFTALMNRQK